MIRETMSAYRYEYPTFELIRTYSHFRPLVDGYHPVCSGPTPEQSTEYHEFILDWYINDQQILQHMTIIQQNIPC